MLRSVSRVARASLCTHNAGVLSHNPARIQVRHLNLHEYQSKYLMDKFDINTQRWKIATTEEEAFKAAQALKCDEYVVKAQIHAGGRGKGHFTNGFKGGVHITKSVDEVKKLTGKMLGQHLITKQTPPNGVLVEKVMVVESINFNKEYYLAIVLDRTAGGPVFVASPMGGMDIEEVAHSSPDKIFKEPVDVVKGLQPAQAKRLAKCLGIADKHLPLAQEQIMNLYKMFITLDCTQLEINPFVQTETGKSYCVDAKLNFDDNAAFRQQEVFSMVDEKEEDPREVAARKAGLNYIAMDGTIGCLVNGAGLAMATMDIIKLYGGSPANFLDVGGGATASQVTQAFQIITSDPQVKAILVNIFGGIMRCDTIAEGVIQAARSLDLKVPLIVRLSGTNVDRGKKLLAESGLKIINATDLDDAAQKAVAAIK